MKKEIILTGFTLPLHKACGNDEMRDMFFYIYFYNKHAYVTNAHIGARIPLSRFGINDEQAAMLEGLCIHKDQFQFIYNKAIVIMPGRILVQSLFTEVILNSDNIKRMARNIEILDGIFDPKDPPVLVEKVGINKTHMQNIMDIIATGSIGNVIFSIYSINKAIIIESTDLDCPGKGLIMPVMLNK